MPASTAPVWIPTRISTGEFAFCCTYLRGREEAGGIELVSAVSKLWQDRNQTNKRDEQEDAWLSAITFNWTNVDLTSPVVASCPCPWPCRLSSVARVACVPAWLSWPHHSVPCGTRYSLYGLHHRESHVDAEHGMIRSLVGCSTNAIITIAENFNAQLLVLLHKREWDRNTDI